MNTNEDNNSIDFEQIVGKNFLRREGERKQRLFNHVLTTFLPPIQI